MKTFFTILWFLFQVSTAYAEPYAVVDAGGAIVNVVEWDGTSEWAPPAGTTVVPVPTGQIAERGGTYANGVFTRYVPPPPTPAQTAAAAWAAGLTLSSTATPALNGVYGLDPASQSNVNATVTYIMLNGTFPGGGSTMPWIDQQGTAHMWPSVAAFKAFATAYANYVAALSLYAASNGTAAQLPSSDVSIP